MPPPPDSHPRRALLRRDPSPDVVPDPRRRFDGLQARGEGADFPEIRQEIPAGRAVGQVLVDPPLAPRIQHPVHQRGERVGMEGALGSRTSARGRSSSWSPQNGAQAQSSLVHLRLGGADRDAEQCRDLPMFVALDFMQHERGPISVRERPQEDVLQQLFRVGRVAREPVRQRVDPPRVGAIERLEGRLLGARLGRPAASPPPPVCRTSLGLDGTEAARVASCPRSSPWQVRYCWRAASWRGRSARADGEAGRLPRRVHARCDETAFLPRFRRIQLDNPTRNAASVAV